jgi:hypothetical protein
MIDTSWLQRVCVVFLLLGATWCDETRAAETQILNKSHADGTCPVMSDEDVARLCNEVGDQLQTDEGDGLTYNYERRLKHAACVQKIDSVELEQEKIRRFWSQNQSRLTCTQLGFSVRKGSLLKLAVERNARSFINDAVRRWKVDLNQVDASDGRTVLDYIQDELLKERGTRNEANLQRYFDFFRRFGAKLQREL